MSNQISVVIADDHPLIRQGLATVLNSQSGIAVVGEAGDGEEAVRQVKGLKPDVVIMDLHMPHMEGAAAIRVIRRQFPKTRVMILTMYDTDEFIFPGLEAGAHSYILKDSAPDELIAAVRAVFRGGSPIEPRVAARVLRRMNAPPEKDTRVYLSEREIEVLRLVARGTTNKEIAEELIVSVNTIKPRLRSIFGKLGVKGRTHAVAEAVRLGILEV
jgi:DNA-binding NarL/FixJ family response regulator